MRGSSADLSGSRSTLLTAAITGTSAGSSLITVAIGADDPRGIEHEHDGIHTGQALAHRVIQPIVEAGAMPRLEAGRVDEHELRIGIGDDAQDAVARRLRLLRRDADLLPDQRVHAASTCRRSAGRRSRHGRSETRRRRLRSLPRAAPVSRCATSATRGFRGRLLRRAAACACARGRDPKRGNPALDFELLRVRLAGRRGHRVLRHRQPTPLQPLLQPRLRILAQRRRIGVRQHVAEAGHDHRARRVEAAIEKHRAEHRLERVGKYRRAVRAAAPLLALAQLDLARRARGCAPRAPAYPD